MKCTPLFQAMSNLLSAWCISRGPPSSGPPDGWNLSAALDTARMTNHAHEVRNMAGKPSSAATIQPPVLYTPTPTSTGSPRKSRMSSVTFLEENVSTGQADSGVDTASGSNVTDKSDESIEEVPNRIEDTEAKKLKNKLKKNGKRSEI